MPSDSSFSEGLSELTKRMFCPSAGYRPSADEVKCAFGLLVKHWLSSWFLLTAYVNEMALGFNGCLGVE